MGEPVPIDFHKMTIQALKRYVLNHRDDQIAFQVLMERMVAQGQSQRCNEQQRDDG